MLIHVIVKIMFSISGITTAGANIFLGESEGAIAVVGGSWSEAIGMDTVTDGAGEDPDLAALLVAHLDLWRELPELVPELQMASSLKVSVAVLIQLHLWGF